jgi:uncharacterized repeat protein (TIGR02543 family)
MKIILSSRSQHYAARLSIFLVTMVLITGMAGCCQPPPSEIVEIQNWYDLDAVRNNLKGSYVLMKDLDETTDGYDELVGETADGKGWQPIGTEGNAFKGEFDGNGRTISDLFIDRPDEDEVGLFGRVQEGVIENLGLENVNVTGKKYVGALVGYSWKGTLDSDERPPGSKTYSRGIVTGEENVGGLVGNNYDGTVNQCESSVEVFLASSAPEEDHWRTGGLVGLNSGTVLHCDYNGVVNGDHQVGGLVGMNEVLVTIMGHVEDCGGEYSVNGNFEVGGVVGRNLGTIRRSSFEGEVNGIMIGDGLVALNEGVTVNAYSSDTEISGSYIGGVVGVNEGTVEDCSAEATVEGYQYVGGLAGANEGTVDDCISGGSVTGKDYVGGLVGYNAKEGTVSNSDSAANVEGTGIYVNDLIGRDANVRYNLRVSSTSGGSVTSPGEGTFACNEGEVINLVATPDTGYQFIEWTGDVQTIANVNAASTIINTNGDYSITANFKLAPTYALTMAVDPVVTGTATDVSGASPYAAGISVSIKAVPAAGYQFVIWTAPAGKFANPSAATTTFTMPPQDVTVTAHFVGPLDHFNCYSAADDRGPISVGEVVYLEDQFGAVQAEVGYAALFCNPVEKWHDGVTPISNPDHHLTVYSLDYEEEPQTWFVGVDNQFGTQYFPTHYESQELIVSGPVGLAVPTQKEGHEPPVGLDHLLLYEVIEGPDVDVYVGLMDQFGDQAEVLVSTPVIFGIPVQKTHDGVVTEIEDPEAHLVFYWIEGGEFETKVQVVNQFGTQTLNMGGPYLLAVPSEKVYYAPFA